MNILRENICRLPLGFYITAATGWWIRVWRESDLNEPDPIDADKDLTELLTRMDQLDAEQISFLSIATAVLNLERVNAVEVSDEEGFGIVEYRDWP